MKQAIRWILVALVSSAVGSLVTYHFTYRAAYARGYWRGEVNTIERNELIQSAAYLGTLQKLEGQNLWEATRTLEKICFASAAIAYKYPPSPTNEVMARGIAKELVRYRAIHRTNSADWDAMEQRLEVALAKMK